jgi:hypothetical protein
MVDAGVVKRGFRAAAIEYPSWIYCTSTATSVGIYYNIGCTPSAHAHTAPAYYKVSSPRGVSRGRPVGSGVRRWPPRHRFPAGHECRLAAVFTASLSEVRKMSSMLSARQREVMLLIAKGLSNKEIARRLEISEGTVAVRLHCIYGSLGSATEQCWPRWPAAQTSRRWLTLQRRQPACWRASSAGRCSGSGAFARPSVQSVLHFTKSRLSNCGVTRT